MSSNKVQIKKAVFPVAGLGTRFLPATKALPKEMLPVVDKPLIQYAAEEAIAAGVNELIFVTSSSKRAIEDHFDKNYEMETELEHKGKTALLELVKNVVPEGVSCVYVRQPEALGLGHAVLCAKPVVGNDPFAVILADDLIDGGGTLPGANGGGIRIQPLQRAGRGECSPGGNGEIWHHRIGSHHRRTESHQQYCREAEPGESAIHAGRGRTLHTDPEDI